MTTAAPAGPRPDALPPVALPPDAQAPHAPAPHAPDPASPAPGALPPDALPPDALAHDAPPALRGRTPTRPTPHPPGLGRVLERNIHALAQRREREEAEATLSDRIAEAVTRFTGSMTFVVLHLLLFGFWIVANLGLVPGVPAWDESFVILAMGASVEAIFLSTFVLISQNRMAASADKRADLDLQISLLAEHEITKLATLLAAVAERVGVPAEADPEIQEIERNVAPEAVLDEIEATAASASPRDAGAT